MNSNYGLEYTENKNYIRKNVNSQQDDFFSKFGKYEVEKAKRKQELIQDYNEFKIKQKEKFENRFSDKKNLNKSLMNNDLATSRHSIYKSNYNDIEFSNNIKKDNFVSDKLKNLEDKISCLYHDINNCEPDNYIEKAHSNPAFTDIYSLKNKGCYESGVNKTYDNDFKNDQRYIINEEALKNRLGMITEAEKRLSSVENEYNKIKSTNIRGNGEVDIDFNDKINAKSKIFNSAIKSNNFKIEQQKQYKFDLETQINENQIRKLISTPSSTGRTNSSGNNVNKTTIQSENILTSNYCDLLHNPINDVNTRSKNQNIAKDYSQEVHKMETSDDKLKKVKYAEDLKQQIREVKAQKAFQKQQDREYDRKIEQQILEYEANKPKGSRLHTNHNHECIQDESLIQDSTLESSHLSTSVYEGITEISQPNHARGGHGIFGNPLTEIQKSNVQKYKEELSKQIIEKQQTLELERLREIENEKRDSERLKADQLKMQKEIDAEKARKEIDAERARKEIRNKEKANEMITKNKKLTKILVEKEKNKVHDLPKISIGKNKKPKILSNKINVPTAKKFSLIHSPELLIGPNLFNSNDKYNSRKNNLRSEKIDERTHTILSQLNNLRTQLDIEKTRIELELNKHKTDINYIGELTSDYRAHPKVNKRASNLFHLNYNDESSLSDDNAWGEMVKKDEIISKVDKKQVAFLKAHDKYLQDLKSELQQKHFALSQAKSNMNNKLMRSNSEQNNDSLMFKSNIFKNNLTYGMNSASNQSIDIHEVTEKNYKRLKRLEALQLLGDVNIDPEAVLEHFITEHDDLYLSNYKGDRL